MGAASRRRRQHAIGFRHLARIGYHKNRGRPLYRKRLTLSVSDAIARERAQAAAEARRRAVKKRS